MSTRPFGKCVNFRVCPKADNRQAIPVAARDANPVCPDCNKPLLVRTPIVDPRRNAFVAVGIVAVLLFVGLGMTLRHYLTSGSNARVAIPATIPVSAVANRSVRTARNVNPVRFVGTVATPPLRSRTVTIPADAPPAYANLLRTADEVNFALYFKRDSDILDNKANVDVGRLVSLLKTGGYRARKLLVAGFCDNTGDSEYSRILSAKRAQTVATELASQGLTVAQTFGFGQVAPIRDNATPEGREKNRRVEIFIAH